MIEFLSLKSAYAELAGQIDEATKRVYESGWYIQGEETAAFEREFADYCSAAHAIGVGNGLDALHLALRAMDVRPGDEVIVSSNTFIATWLAVSMVGALPVPVEPLEGTHNLDPDKVEAAITPRTRVLLPTHLYGQPADIAPLLEIARRHGLRVLEDAAQAHGARYRDRKVGAHGDACAWSFYPGKNLGAMGDGGAVTTDDDDLAACIRVLGNYGSSQKYVHDVQGINSRLDPVQAAVLRVKLRFLDEWNARRAAIARLYLGSLDAGRIGLPAVPQWAEPSWHLFVVNLPQRDCIQKQLANAGIQTIIHYPIPPHRQRAYASMNQGRGAFPIAERLADRVLSLPIGPHMSSQDAEAIVREVNRAAKQC